MGLMLISVVRYFVNGLIAFHIFNDSNKAGINKTAVQSIIYTILLAAFKIFVMDKPVITAVSFMIIFLCLLIANKFKSWKVPLTYSLFVTCMLEYTHFLIFKVFSLTRDSLNIPEVTSDDPQRLIISRIIVLLMYCAAALLIYKLNKSNIKSVPKLAQYNIFPTFLSIALFVIMYLKHYIKYTSSNKFHDVLSVIFVFFIILCLTFLFSSKAFLKMIENYQKKKINPAIEEAKLQKGKGYPGLKFKSEKLNHQAKFFKDELTTLGIDTEDNKAKQLVHSAVLLCQENNPLKVNMVSGIYFYTGEILELQPKSIETNIGNLMKTHWGFCDSEALLKIKQNYHGPISKENCAPTPREFILYLIKKHRKHTKIYDHIRNIKYLFLKKRFANA